MKVAPLDAPSLTTEHLLLRMLQDSDFEEYAAIHADPEVTKFTVRTQLTRMEAWRHLAVIVGHWHLRGFGMWGVFERESGALVGPFAQLRPASRVAENAQVGNFVELKNSTLGAGVKA